jgi:DNA invertase Pin-like site-specific DNA recombinase
MKEKETLYIYTRVSTEEQQIKDLSLPRQKDLGLKKAKELDMVPKLVIEGGESASHENLDNRPELVRLLNLIRDGEAKHIFAFDQTRLSRNDLTKAIISETFRKAGAKLYTHSRINSLIRFLRQLSHMNRL